MELPRADSAAGDFFGAAVAIHDDFVLVGATGIDACGPNSGAAFIYERIPDSDLWQESAQLTPSDCDEGSFFGRSVDLYGRFAVVAASREFFSEETPNAVYVFERDRESGTWNEVAKLTGGSAATEGAFATSISIDGERILVTTSGDPVHGRFGGAAYIFERDEATGTWKQSARLTGSKGIRSGIFGTAGDLEGDVASVAASTYFRNRAGSVYIFEREGPDGWWREAAGLGEVEDFFISVDVNNARVLAGESKSMRDDSGSATLFERGADGTWKPSFIFRPNEPYDAGAFGSAVALEEDYALIVGYDEQLGLNFNIDRVVFVFKRSGDTWRQHHVIDVGEVAFGADLDIHARLAVIGSASDSEPGAVYVVHIPE